MTRTLLRIAPLCLGACVLLFSQDQIPPIKGHVLGETVQECLAKMSGGVEYLQACRLASDKKTAKKLKVNPFLCESLIAAVDIGKRRLQLNIGKDFSADFSDAFDIAHFAEGKLVMIELHLGQDRKIMRRLMSAPPQEAISYDHVLQDMITRFGAPTGTETITTQNGYGAKFEYPRAIWELPGIFVAVQSIDSSIDTPVTLVIVSTQEERAIRLKAELASRKDSLR